MQCLPPALLPLGAWPQFVAWFATPKSDGSGKFDKFPVDWRSGKVINAHDPQYWTTADVALAMAPSYDRGYGSGCGFVFTPQDPFFFLDTDHAYADGQWSPIAVELCGRLAGAGVEVSHSGTGLHQIGRAAAMPHGCKNTALGLELYTSGRFVALTGTNAVGDVTLDCTAQLAQIIGQYFPPLEANTEFEDWTTEAVAGSTAPGDDEDLLRRALATGSNLSVADALNGKLAGVSFAELWHAEPSLGERWPHDRNAFDHSHADMALANMLAFWTGKNCERMERLMRRSALMREKWDTHRTYLVDTILKACSFTQTVYSHQGPAPVTPSVSPEAMAAQAAATSRELRDASREYLGPFDQLEFFEGCVFDNASERIYSLKQNTVFSKSAFDINYGGHMFVLDPSSQKTTDSAWEAFTRSRVNVPVIVDALCFRPEEPPGAVVRDGARTYANSYVPYAPKMVAGDPAPFLDLLERQLPDVHDRKIILSYMASLVQNPGKKFQWWPVIQGVEGNGKSLLAKALEFAVGQEYTHQPNAAAMARDGNKFNGWIYRKLLIIVEEICLSSRRDFLDEFKVVVTNDRIPIEKKGQDQITGDNRVNGVLFTNHKDGVPITIDGRRYAIFFTAQQTEEHLERDGMTAAYFMNLFDWFKGIGAHAHLGRDHGAACISHFLHTMPIEAEYDPALLSTRAPKTSSTDEALIHSRGRAEQEVMAAVEEGRPGFAGGWVSAKALDTLLETIRAPVARNKRRAMMQSLGYDWHPGLEGTITSERPAPENVHTRLYIKRGHLMLNLDHSAAISRAYSKAQEPATSSALGAVLGLTPPSILP